MEAVYRLWNPHSKVVRDDRVELARRIDHLDRIYWVLGEQVSELREHSECLVDLITGQTAQRHLVNVHFERFQCRFHVFNVENRHDDRFD